jgi:hypothetical protein
MAKIHDPELVRSLRTTFPARDEASYAWGNILSCFTMLPKLRGLWFCGNVDEGGEMYDLSGQGRTLTDANTPTYGLDGLASYATYVRASSQRHYRLDEAGLDITDDLTLFTWVRFTTSSKGVLTGILSKWLTAGSQKSYLLYKDASDIMKFAISDDGSAVPVAVPSSVTWDSSQWYFMVGRFDPSTKASIYVNDVFDDDTTGIPASIFNGSDSFRIASSDAGNHLDGDVAIAGLANYAFPDYLIRALYHKSRRLFGV